MNKSLLLEAINQSNLNSTTKSFLSSILKGKLTPHDPKYHIQNPGWADQRVSVVRDYENMMDQRKLNELLDQFQAGRRKVESESIPGWDFADDWEGDPTKAIPESTESVKYNLDGHKFEIPQ